MFNEDYIVMANGAKGKAGFLKKNPLGYFLYSMLAGAYIGFGVLLVFTLSGALNGSPFTKLVMGCCFGVALSLVVIAGAELFTGNNMVMAAGVLRKTVTLGDAVKLWIVCWIGNVAGAALLAVIFWLTGWDMKSVDLDMPYGDFLANAPAFNPRAELIKGAVCGVRVEEIKDPLTKRMRQLDKLIDDLSKGKSMDLPDEA